ncbi:hypothetical protein Rsub_08708 [Raphidocelis subcapitata]|uniref:Serine protease n=1 Tax=Raphidocelis subcapitata TaxID=307507 RepID=A0A2V0P7B1_9CHLO|nr:hypothetical protein Rsub_08708 [Raphidocelis subcapitata]|eukprot:GBF95726.1 hypothetical protein Rsub_08708 [Raphidocelis subcapitata]
MVIRVLAMLALLAVAASAAPDCSAGCVLSGEPVCGANGITFMNDCLALCAGAGVAHAGACAAPGSVAAASAEPAPLEKHPIGQFLAFGAASASDAVSTASEAPRAVSASDIARFASEGYALVGPARLGDFAVTKPEKSPVSTAARASMAAASDKPVFAVRVLPDEGLVYVSARPIVPESAAGLTSASTPSELPTASAAPVEAAAAIAPGEPLASASDVHVARARVRSSGRKLRAPGWDEVTELLDYPYKAIGWLNIGFASGSGSCSGSVFAKSAVVTAAHCVYDRYSGSSIRKARFTPHHFFNTRGALTTPYGSVEAYSFDFLSGWSENDDIERAWVSDMAVILLKKEVGPTTGMLGFAYDEAGYSGPISAAGYPGESPRVQGMYYRLKGTCNLQDADGTDGQMDFKTPTQNTCLTPCSIAEQGQSGQPAYVADGANFVVRGVLSHGPPAGQCYGYDTYTEVDKLHYNFLAGYRTWSAPQA